MAGEPQGLFFFNNFASLLSATFTVSQGVSPSTCQLAIQPQGQPIPPVGTLRLSYGGTSILWPDCRVSKAYREVDANGLETWFISLLDTRWRWKYGSVDGEYNVRSDDTAVRNDGQDILVGGVGGLGQQRIRFNTVKTVQELAQMCFDQWGVTANVAILKNEKSYPRISWRQGTRPDHALTEVLDPLGYRVALQPDNKVVVVKSGEGADLPTGPDVLDFSTGNEPSLRSDSLVFIGAPTEWEVQLELEAVGLDRDGSYKPLDKLSYKPPGGWETYAGDIYFHGLPGPPLKEDYIVQGLARQSVYKCYRIVEPVDGGEMLTNVLKANGGKRERWRILPTLDRRPTKAKVAGREQFLAAHLIGVFDPEEVGTDENVTIAQQHLFGDAVLDWVKEPGGVYYGGFSLDAELGIITLSSKLTREDRLDPRGKVTLPALLRLVIGVNVRDQDSGAFTCRQKERKLPRPLFGTGPGYIVRSDIALRFAPPDAGKPLVIGSNQKEFDGFAEHYLDAAEKELEDKRPATATYGGFRPIPVDGAIQQTTYWVDSRGFAWTRASRNTEHDALAPSYKDALFNQNLRALIDAKAVAPVPPKP